MGTLKPPKPNSKLTLTQGLTPFVVSQLSTVKLRVDRNEICFHQKRNILLSGNELKIFRENLFDLMEQTRGDACELMGGELSLGLNLQISTWSFPFTAVARYRGDFLAQRISSDADTVPTVLIPKHLQLRYRVHLTRIPREACRCFVSQEKKLAETSRGIEMGMEPYCFICIFTPLIWLTFK